MEFHTVAKTSTPRKHSNVSKLAPTYLLSLSLPMNMALNQEVRQSRRRLPTGEHPARVTKHRRSTRNGARLEAIQHHKKPMDFEDQDTEQHPVSSPSTNNTHISRSQSLPIWEKPSGIDQRPSRKRKRPQSIEDLVLQTKSFTRGNEDHYQLLSPLTSNSHDQLSKKKRRRAGSIKSRSEETNNRYSKRRDASRQAPQTVHVHEAVPETDSLVLARSEPEPEALKSEKKEKDDPISYWAANHTWPTNFAEPRAMSSNQTNKRPRTLDRSSSGKDERTPSYSQSRKDGDVPEQYTKSYEKYLFTQGLDMNYIKGRDFVSPDSKVACQELQKMECATISPTIYSEDKILQVVDLCQNTNEAMVSRDITTLILPPIKALHLMDEANRFKDSTDQVRAQWHESWVLAGPRPEPDLAVGFLHSAFTVSENEKLTNYTSFENLTRPTNEMCFPFLMCEVKCGDKGLDYADRQNMHSCSVAVKALLKLEQKADQFRDDKQFESLLGKILVFSISHDQNDARVWGHYALVEGEKWTYYRHHIEKFDIAHKEGALLALHNFARNVITVYAPKLLERLQKAIAALPVSSTLPVSTTLSFSAGTISLDDSRQGSQQPSQGRDADGFAIPDLPLSTSKLLDERKEAKEQMDRLLQQLEQQRQDHKDREKEQKEQINDLREQIKGLMDMLKQRLS